MKNAKLLTILSTIAIFCFSSCEKEFAKYYKDDGPKETIYEVLTNRGEFKIFTEALNLVGYGEVLSKAGLFTVIAVDDVAFKSYLESKGYTSVKEVPLDELKVLMGYHIFDWPYIVSKLHSGYSSSEMPEDPLMIRKLTRCLPPVYREYDAGNEIDRLVIKEKKLMPFYSSDYLEAMDISAQDVLGFYHDLNADLIAGDVIASHGLLIEKDIFTVNGWLHRADRVLTPLRNQLDVIEQEADYSIYKNLIKSFATFSFNAGYTNEYQIDYDGNGDNDSLYTMNLFDLNKEYVGVSGSISGNSDKINVQKKFISAFIPTNEAITSFFSTYYPHISINNIANQIAPPALRSIITSCIYNGDAWFPSAVAAGRLKTKYGMPYVYEEGDYQKREVVSNGLFYGVKNFRAPDEFNSLARAFMTDSTYSHFLVALDQTRYLNTLVSGNVDFTVFALKNKTFRESGYFLDETQTKFVDDLGNNVNFSEIAAKIKNHIVLGELNVSAFNDKQFFRTIAPREAYINVSSTQVSADGVQFASILDDGNYDGNGVIYEINNFLSSPGSDITIGYYLKNSPQFSTFHSLLVQVGIIDNGNKNTVLFNEGNMTCFAPTNNALASVTLPSDKQELKEYLAKFFIKKTIFSDGQQQGAFETFAKDLVNSTPTLSLNVGVEIRVDSGVITIVNNSTGESAVTTSGFESDKMLYNGSLHTIESVY